MVNIGFMGRSDSGYRKVHPKKVFGPVVFSERRFFDLIPTMLGAIDLNVRTYAIYDVGIQPSTTEDLAYDQGTERFIVYPGIVMRLDRSVQPVVIVVGQLIDADGKSLPGALLRMTETVGRTNQDGYFQIDAIIGQTIRATRANGEICRFEIPNDMDSDQAYADLGLVNCD